jgi:hypothetical protein
MCLYMLSYPNPIAERPMVKTPVISLIQTVYVHIAHQSNETIIFNF